MLEEVLSMPSFLIYSELHSLLMSLVTRRKDVDSWRVHLVVNSGETNSEGGDQG